MDYGEFLEGRALPLSFKDGQEEMNTGSNHSVEGEAAPGTVSVEGAADDTSGEGGATVATDAMDAVDDILADEQQTGGRFSSINYYSSLANLRDTDAADHDTVESTVRTSAEGGASVSHVVISDEMATEKYIVEPAEYFEYDPTEERDVNPALQHRDADSGDESDLEETEKLSVGQAEPAEQEYEQGADFEIDMNPDGDNHDVADAPVGDENIPQGRTVATTEAIQDNAGEGEKQRKSAKKKKNQAGQVIVSRDKAWCDACKTHGHWTMDCTGPLDEAGYFHVCPFHNTLDHTLMDCEDLPKLNMKWLYGEVVRRRAGMAPIPCPWNPFDLMPDRWVRGNYPQTPGFAKKRENERGIQPRGQWEVDPFWLRDPPNKEMTGEDYKKKYGDVWATASPPPPLPRRPIPQQPRAPGNDKVQTGHNGQQLGRPVAAQSQPPREVQNRDGSRSAGSRRSKSKKKRDRDVSRHDVFGPSNPTNSNRRSDVFGPPNVAGRGQSRPPPDANRNRQGQRRPGPGVFGPPDPDRGCRSAAGNRSESPIDRKRKRENSPSADSGSRNPGKRHQSDTDRAGGSSLTLEGIVSALARNDLPSIHRDVEAFIHGLRLSQTLAGQQGGHGQGNDISRAQAEDRQNRTAESGSQGRRHYGGQSSGNRYYDTPARDSNAPGSGRPNMQRPRGDVFGPPNTSGVRKNTGRAGDRAGTNVQAHRGASSSRGDRLGSRPRDPERFGPLNPGPRGSSDRSGQHNSGRSRRGSRREEPPSHERAWSYQNEEEGDEDEY